MRINKSLIMLFIIYMLKIISTDEEENNLFLKNYWMDSEMLIH